MQQQRLNDWLEKYPCGPGGHDFIPTGIQMSPTARAVQPGQDFEAPDDEMTKCSRCPKTGWLRTPTCEICGNHTVHVLQERMLVLADGTRLKSPALCDSCHIDIRDARDPRVSIEWS